MPNYVAGNTVCPPYCRMPRSAVLWFECVAVALTHARAFVVVRVVRCGVLAPFPRARAVQFGVVAVNMGSFLCSLIVCCCCCGCGGGCCCCGCCCCCCRCCCCFVYMRMCMCVWVAAAAAATTPVAAAAVAMIAAAAIAIWSTVLGCVPRGVLSVLQSIVREGR